MTYAAKVPVAVPFNRGTASHRLAAATRSGAAAAVTVRVLYNTVRV